jgi:hypothetical protein
MLFALAGAQALRDFHDEVDQAKGFFETEFAMSADAADVADSVQLDKSVMPCRAVQRWAAIMSARPTPRRRSFGATYQPSM